MKRLLVILAAVATALAVMAPTSATTALALTGPTATQTRPLAEARFTYLAAVCPSEYALDELFAVIQAAYAAAARRGEPLPETMTPRAKAAYAKAAGTMRRTADKLRRVKTWPAPVRQTDINKLVNLFDQDSMLASTRARTGSWDAGRRWSWLTDAYSTFYLVHVALGINTDRRPLPQTRWDIC
jgi:hypothetical protein